MAIRIRTSVLLLAVISHTFGGLHQIDDLVDGILADLRTYYKPYLELDDLKAELKTGKLYCFKGTGSSLASLVRHGLARQEKTIYNYETKVWANITIEPFSFRYEGCAIRNDTDYEFIGHIGGRTMFSSGYFSILVQRGVFDHNCTVRITKYYIEDLFVVFDKSYDNSTILRRLDRNGIKNAVKQDITSSINITLTDYMDKTYKDATMCN